MKSKHMKSHRATILKLLCLVLLMFGFSFALVPLYNVFCQVTGLNGKVDINSESSLTRYRITPDQISARLITVEFDVNLHKNLPCEITPQHTALPVHPGQLTLTSYQVKNLSNQAITIQAIPSISPGIAAKYLKKLECFCFTQQKLKPYETVSLPLRFWLEPEIPASVHRLTLSYTLFNVAEELKGENRGT